MGRFGGIVRTTGTIVGTIGAIPGTIGVIVGTIEEIVGTIRAIVGTKMLKVRVGAARLAQNALWGGAEVVAGRW